MASSAVRWGVELEGGGLEWDKVCQIVMEVTDDVCLVVDRLAGSPFHWGVCHDGSIQLKQPFELKSPAFTGEAEGFDRLRAVTAALREAGGVVDRSCGLHVHHDAAYALKVLAGDASRYATAVHTLYAAFEGAFDKLMSLSRRGTKNTMILSLMAGRHDLVNFFQLDDDKRTIEVLGEKDMFVQLRQGADHHYKVNVSDAILHHGTIEYRHHSATLQASKIIPWVRLTGLVQEKAVELALGNLEFPGRSASVTKLLGWLEAEPLLVTYWEERAAGFVNPNVDSNDEIETPDADYTGDGLPKYMDLARKGNSDKRKPYQGVLSSPHIRQPGTQRERVQPPRINFGEVTTEEEWLGQDATQEMFDAASEELARLRNRVYQLVTEHGRATGPARRHDIAAEHGRALDARNQQQNWLNRVQAQLVAQQEEEANQEEMVEVEAPALINLERQTLHVNVTYDTGTTGGG